MRKRIRRHRLRFDKPVTTKDAYGGDEGDWTEVVTLRGEIERAQSFRFDVERVTGGGERSTPTARLWIDYTSVTATIDHTHRAVDLDTGKTFNVAFVQDLEGKSRTLCVTATEEIPS